MIMKKRSKAKAKGIDRFPCDVDSVDSVALAAQSTREYCSPIPTRVACDAPPTQAHREEVANGLNGLQSYRMSLWSLSWLMVVDLLS